MAFWEQALAALREANVTLYQNISPSRDHWVSAGSGLSGSPYSLIFGKGEARVELYISRAAAEENTRIFENLLAKKDEIEKAFGKPLDWQSLEGKKACRIAHAKPFDGYNRETWPEVTAWMIEHIQRLEAAFRAPLQRAGAAMRAQERAA